jgi:serine/threonine-protein phosphatase 6 regulatory ankyrin repeat subunit B
MGAVSFMRRILDHGMSVNIPSAVLNAALVGNCVMAKILLDRGVDVNVQVTGEDNTTPLHSACVSGSVEMVRLLLESGADGNVSTSTDKRTPLHWATQEGHLEVIELLLIFRANISARDKFGFTPRYLAVEKRHENIMEFLAIMSVTKRPKFGAS